jgi:hypothetical protein
VCSGNLHVFEAKTDSSWGLVSMFKDWKRKAGLHRRLSRKPVTFGGSTTMEKTAFKEGTLFLGCSYGPVQVTWDRGRGEALINLLRADCSKPGRIESVKFMEMLNVWAIKDCSLFMYLTVPSSFRLDTVAIFSSCQWEKSRSKGILSRLSCVDRLGVLKKEWNWFLLIGFSELQKP